jgi:hypothetical protein
MDIAKTGSTVVIVATNADGRDQENLTINAPVQRPTITVRIPQQKTVNTTKAVENLTLVATNTTSKSQISIRLNNVNFTNFNYNNGVVTAQLPLKNGSNTVAIVVQNSGGKASETIIFNRSVSNTGSTVTIAKPTIRFTTPNRSGSTVSAAAFNIQAQVTDVATKDNVSVKVNGKVVKNVAFNGKNGAVSCSTTLQEGNNTIVIVARNAKGVTTQSTTVIYKAAANSRPSGRTGN